MAARRWWTAVGMLAALAVDDQPEILIAAFRVLGRFPDAPGIYSDDPCRAYRRERVEHLLVGRRNFHAWPDIEPHNLCASYPLSPMASRGDYA